MKSIGAYVFGFLAFFPLALIALVACLNALSDEADNRAARQLQQLQQDKRLLLKVPAMWRGRAVEDCQIVKDELRCLYHTKSGELKMLAAK